MEVAPADHRRRPAVARGADPQDGAGGEGRAQGRVLGRAASRARGEARGRRAAERVPARRGRLRDVRLVAAPGRDRAPAVRARRHRGGTERAARTGAGLARRRSRDRGEDRRTLPPRLPRAVRAPILARNEAWVDRIANMLDDDETVFILMGTGHLVGPDGVPRSSTAPASPPAAFDANAEAATIRSHGRSSPIPEWPVHHRPPRLRPARRPDPAPQARRRRDDRRLVPPGALSTPARPSRNARPASCSKSPASSDEPLVCVGVAHMHVYGADSLQVLYAADCDEGDVVLSHEHSAFRWMDAAPTATATSATSPRERGHRHPASARCSRTSARPRRLSAIAVRP